MIEIKKLELKDKYGIDLSTGEYAIDVVGDKYKIYSLTSDSIGCILVGLNKVKGGLVNSRATSDRLNILISGAILNGEDVSITII